MLSGISNRGVYRVYVVRSNFRIHVALTHPLYARETNMPPETRKRGRPPVLRQCASCGQDKPSMAFKGPTYDVCLACMSGVRASGDPTLATRSNRSYMDEIRAQNPIPVHQPIQAVMTDVILMEATKKFLTTIVEPLQRCECCWETRHVRRDSYAAAHVLCARCELQVKERGCCRLHNSCMLYAELAEGKPTTPADEPLEITIMFSTVVPKRETENDAALVEPDI